MARRKAIPRTISTRYFSDVTPFWVPPGQHNIPSKYHDAVWALAEWAGPKWSENEETNFLLIRDLTIRRCEDWTQHDWHSEETWLIERRQDAKRLKASNKLGPIISAFLGPNRFKRMKVLFVINLLRALGMDKKERFTNGRFIDAFDDSLRYLVSQIEHGDTLPFSYGPIEYSRLPKSIPRRSVVLALCLADQITFFRKDGHSRGTLLNPHKPNLSAGLPWKAIALFVSTNVEGPDDILAEENVQTLVESLASTVSYIRWSPQNRSN